MNIANRLVAFTNRFIDYQHYVSIVLIAVVIVEMTVGLPAAAYIYGSLVVFFSLMLAGNLIKQRREMPYA